MVSVSLEDLVVIESAKQLRNLYSHYYDGQEVDNLVSLFTEDAICEFPDQFGGHWIGRPAIKENFQRMISGYEGPPYGLLHSVTNPWIRIVDENTANGRWYLHDLRTTVGAKDPIILYGIYDDIYKKIEGEWLIHRTRIDFLWPNRIWYGYRTAEELES